MLPGKDLNLSQVEQERIPLQYQSGSIWSETGQFGAGFVLGLSCLGQISGSQINPWNIWILGLDPSVLNEMFYPTKTLPLTALSCVSAFVPIMRSLCCPSSR